VDAVKTILDIRGTERVEVNPLTGSVVITYDAAVINSQELFNVLQHHGFYSEGRAITLDAQIQQASHKAARKVGRAFFGWAVGRVLEDSGLAFIAALI
jgi:copper chaperone CopZ